MGLGDIGRAYSENSNPSSLGPPWPPVVCIGGPLHGMLYDVMGDRLEANEISDLGTRTRSIKDDKPVEVFHHSYRRETFCVACSGLKLTGEAFVHSSLHPTQAVNMAVGYMLAGAINMGEV